MDAAQQSQEALSFGALGEAWPRVDITIFGGGDGKELNEDCKSQVENVKDIAIGVELTRKANCGDEWKETIASESDEHYCVVV